METSTIDCIQGQMTDIDKMEEAVPTEITLQKTIPLAEAWDMPWELIPLQDAVGRHVAEFINLYPPGVPLLVPGEVLQEQQCKQILQYLEQQLNVQGVSERPPHQVKVLCCN